MAKEKNGYIFESNGKWFARVTFTDATGKRRNVKKTADNKAEAKKHLKSIVKLLENENEQKVIDCQKVTFSDLADFYEDNFVKPAKFIDNTKVEGLRDIIHIKAFLTIYRAFFGNRKLRDIAYSDLRALKTERLNTLTQRKKRRSVTTVNRELACLRRIFNVGVQQGWLERNPFSCGSALIQVSAERKRERILTIEEESRLLNACENPHRAHLKPLLIALLDTGARKGEMLKLVWRDIDFEKRIITIRALNTKTLKSRQIAITKRLHSELLNMWQQLDALPDSPVFGISNNVRKSFSSACKIAGINEGGIEGLTLHSLRHTAATRLVKGQLPIQFVGRILGHSQPQTTYRYLSANDDTLRQASAIFESLQD